MIGISEELLRGRHLDVEHMEIQPTGKHEQPVGPADLDDMWAIWNTATPEERRLIVDLAKRVVWQDEEVMGSGTRADAVFDALQ